MKEVITQFKENLEEEIKTLEICGKQYSPVEYVEGEVKKAARLRVLKWYLGYIEEFSKEISDPVGEVKKSLCSDINRLRRREYERREFMYCNEKIGPGVSLQWVEQDQQLLTTHALLALITGLEDY